MKGSRRTGKRRRMERVGFEWREKRNLSKVLDNKIVAFF
jgi:hypothetical protein